MPTSLSALAAIRGTLGDQERETKQHVFSQSLGSSIDNRKMQHREALLVVRPLSSKRQPGFRCRPRKSVYRVLVRMLSAYHLVCGNAKGLASNRDDLITKALEKYLDSALLRVVGPDVSKLFEAGLGTCTPRVHAPLLADH